METINKRESWNKGKLVDQKSPLKPKDIWAIRIHLQNAHAVRDLAMFNLAIDSKLRGCDRVSLRVRDVTQWHQVLPRAMVIQRKSKRPVQFELTEPTSVAVSAWLEKSLVHEGLGVTPVPALACPPPGSGLCFVPLVKPVRKRTIGLMRLLGRSLLPVAGDFVELLQVRSNTKGSRRTPSSRIR